MVAVGCVTIVVSYLINHFCSNMKSLYCARIILRSNSLISVLSVAIACFAYVTAEESLILEDSTFISIFAFLHFSVVSYNCSVRTSISFATSSDSFVSRECLREDSMSLPENWDIWVFRNASRCWRRSICLSNWSATICSCWLIEAVSLLKFPFS